MEGSRTRRVPGAVLSYAGSVELKFPVTMAAGSHPFPSRTRKLSPPAPMVLGGRPPGRVGRRRNSSQDSPCHERRCARAGAVARPGCSSGGVCGPAPGAAQGRRRAAARVYRHAATRTPPASRPTAYRRRWLGSGRPSPRASVPSVDRRLPGLRVVDRRVPGLRVVDRRLPGLRVVDRRVPGLRVVDRRVPGLRVVDRRRPGLGREVGRPHRRGSLRRRRPYRCSPRGSSHSPYRRCGASSLVRARHPGAVGP